MQLSLYFSGMQNNSLRKLENIRNIWTQRIRNKKKWEKESYMIWIVSACSFVQKSIDAFTNEHFKWCAFGLFQFIGHFITHVPISKLWPIYLNDLYVRLDEINKCQIMSNLKYHVLQNRRSSSSKQTISKLMFPVSNIFHLVCTKMSCLNVHILLISSAALVHLVYCTEINSHVNFSVNRSDELSSAHVVSHWTFENFIQIQLF